MPVGRMPASVRYVRGLLWLQGSIWGMFAFFSVIDLAVGIPQMMAHHDGAPLVALLVVIALTGGFALVKVRLAGRVARGGRRTRRTVIGVETAMTCLGALMTAAGSPSGGLPADMVILAGMGGAGLSLAAVIAFLRGSARQFFAAAAAADPGDPKPPAGPGSAFLRHSRAAATFRLVQG